eukprot:4114614-Pyramimonas_sp.AAC.1
MMYSTELFDTFILVQSDIVVLILDVSRSTVGLCVLVEFTLTTRVFNAFDILVNRVRSADHINVINMLGREQ